MRYEVIFHDNKTNNECRCLYKSGLDLEEVIEDVRNNSKADSEYCYICEEDADGKVIAIMAEDGSVSFVADDGSIVH